MPTKYRKNLTNCIQYHSYCLLLCFVLAGSVCVVFGGCNMAKQQPNIILILADDLGTGDLGCYGAKDAYTPNIDSLAANGMKMLNFYAASPVCSPTRAALLSGQNPYETGVPGVIRSNPDDSWGYLLPQVVLLPKLLAEQSYQTALIGKWHLGLELPNLPNERGFDYFEGFLGDKMDDYYTHLREGQNYLRKNKEVINPQGHATDLFTQWACNYIEIAAKEKQPFFLYLAYNAPHNPIQPLPEWVAAYNSKYPNVPELRAKYGAFVAHLDAGIGKVLQTLSRLHLDENTLIIFTSDNGASLDHGGSNGNLRNGKPTLYEGGLKVPMLVRYPELIKPGSIASQTAITTDIVPTLINLLPSLKNNRQLPAGDGLSLLPVLQGNANSHDAFNNRLLFWFLREGGDVFGNGATIEACRLNNWKLLRVLPDAMPQLYNLAADPEETCDLAATDTAMYNKLYQLLEQQKQAAIKMPYRPPQSN